MWVCISLIIPLAGSILAISGDGAKKAGGIALVLSSPLIMFLILLRPALFLGGVYAIDSGIESGEMINQSHLIIGCVLYGIGLLMQLNNNSSKSKD